MSSHGYTVRQSMRTLMRVISQNGLWLVVAIVAQGSLHAQPPTDQPKASDDLATKFGLGAAVGFRWNVLKPDIVSDATVDSNGFVRVNQRANTNAGLWLETHFFPYEKKLSDQAVMGLGPFIALQAGSDQIISAAGAGFMVGFKHKTEDRLGFGIGAGYAGIPSAKTLGDEFIDGQLAPKGPDGKSLPVRFEQRDKGSVIIVFSVTYALK